MAKAPLPNSYGIAVWLADLAPWSVGINEAGQMTALFQVQVRICCPVGASSCSKATSGVDLRGFL